jgi:mannose-6-phosphate isomerase-like protein (cupin superfamily)
MAFVRSRSQEHPVPDPQTPHPYVDDIEKAALGNENFREALFTGEQMQLTVMSIPVGGEVGLEMHEGLDQFLRLEQGRARVVMGPAEDQLDLVGQEVEDDWAIVVPGATWHNIINVGDEPLKLYSLYSPPEHPAGTIHQTKADADADADEHDH